jgi:hypothetical protein
MLEQSKKTDTLIQSWYKFRQTLELVPDPLKTTSDFFLSTPRAKFYTDPYNETTWPTPWELISENEYCAFNVVLGICYTLQLTERFSKHLFEVAVAIDNYSKDLYYLLYINNEHVFQYPIGEWLTKETLSPNLTIKKQVVMGGVR